ncbi:MAG TPA: hypothetical protein VJS66_04470 [Burkholderiales bacterium]|nr:hypothetical protein [Burkholderiales bacterium]
MGTPAIRRIGAAANWLSIFTSTSTLVCCALPALLVGLGAGTALISLTGAFPQLIWLSENKVGLFVVAGLMLAVAGVFQRYTTRLPCPADPTLAQACIRQRRISRATYVISCVIYSIGGFFAFIAPWFL